MSAEVGLTEAEREALSTVLPVSEWDYDPDRFKVEVEAVVAHIVTDRVADAIAQERAESEGWAATTDDAETLTEALGDIRLAGARQADWWESDEAHPALVRALRAECAPWAEALLVSDWLAERDARIKADAIAQERAAWVAKIEALANEPGSGFPYVQVADLRALLSTDAEQVSR